MGKYDNISLVNDKNSKIGDFAAEMSTAFITARNSVVFPFVMSSILIDEPDQVEKIQRIVNGDRQIGFFPEIPPYGLDLSAELEEVDIPTFKYEDMEISKVGCLARITKHLTFPDGSVRILVRGLRRITLNQIKMGMDKSPRAIYTPDMNGAEVSNELLATMKLITNSVMELIPFMNSLPDELKMSVQTISDPVRQIDLMADVLRLNYAERLAILGKKSLEERALLMLSIVNRECEIAKIGHHIHETVNSNLSQQQREYYLREQLRTIQQELREDTRTPDIIDLENRLEELDAPMEVFKAIKKEMGRLEVVPQMSPEYHIAYNYVDWMLSLPWYNCSETHLDLAEAEKILNDDHYGLEDVKERILDYLAVLQLRNEDGKAPILCLVGPPGVGKTSLGQSIARAMGRKFVRLALGGVHDESEIRGHRRTYVGAMPGRILQSMKKVGVANPVFMLDEIDKLGRDHRGDPASALLEVLDPAQNNAFNDHYIELDYDLSKVCFVATANSMESIPGPLLDRMEIIRLPGYTGSEKRQIAKQYLVGRQVAESGLTSKQISFPMSALDELINYYTREAGVRSLERVIGSVCRKMVRRLLSGESESDKRVSVTPKLIHELLGGRKFSLDEVKNRPKRGSAVGMAWTGYGGTTLLVESTMMPGKGVLKLTGSLGTVMKESAEAAFSYIRSNAKMWDIKKEVFENNDFHIHVPDGATPKDGPSAGITITTALVSLITGKRPVARLSMTGEITLGGKVTAIGGLKEKSVAALRAGVKTVIMPKENEKDLEDIPEDVKNQLNFVMVDEITTALPIIFGDKLEAVSHE